MTLFLVVHGTGLRNQLSSDLIRELFEEHIFWGLVLFCLAFSVGNLLYVPCWVFLVGAVFALGKEWGGVATFIAGLCSSTLSFYIIRWLGGTALRSLNHRWADNVFAHLDGRPILSVTLITTIVSDASSSHLCSGFGGYPLPPLYYWHLSWSADSNFFVLLFFLMPSSTLCGKRTKGYADAGSVSGLSIRYCSHVFSAVSTCLYWQGGISSFNRRRSKSEFHVGRNVAHPHMHAGF